MKCEEIIEYLNESDLTKTIDFASKGIRPTFFRLVASWRNGPRKRAVGRFLRRYNLKATIEPLPIRLLYKQPFMRLQKHLSATSVNCVNAENRIRKGFVLAV